MSAAGNQRLYFEDVSQGQSFPLAAMRVTKKEIIAFATEFDPLPFHLDEAIAKKSILGGLAASGWQTAALTFGEVVKVFVANIAGMGSPEIRKVRWHKPFFPRDIMTGTVTILTKRASKSRPEMGILELGIETHNQKGKIIISYQLVNMIERRNAGDAA